MPGRTATPLDLTVGQTHQAAQMLRDAGMSAPATENVLITAGSGALDRAQADAATADLVSRASGLTDVAQAGDPVTAQDGQAVLVPLVIRGDADTAAERIGPLGAALHEVQENFPGLRLEQVGEASLSNALADLATEDLEAAGVISLPVTLAILLVVFGALLAAGVPVLLGLSAVATASGLSVLVSYLVPSTGSTSAMILLMGMAVGVDYSLFYVKRYREERARHQDHLDAVQIAAETSGHSVLVSGLAVVISMASLFLVGDVTFSSLGAGSVLVVAIAVVGSLTVLPALLAGLGRAMNRPRVPLVWRLTASTRPPRLWPALLRPALNHPGRTLVTSVLLPLALAAPALSMTLADPDEKSLPTSLPTVSALHRMTAAFPGERTSHDVVVAAPTAATADTAEQRLNQFTPFAGAGTELSRSADGRVLHLVVATAVDSSSTEARAQVEALRTQLPSVLAGTEARWAVGGAAAGSVDYADNLQAKLPWVVGAVLLATTVMMLVVFRSPALALITAATNLLSVAAAFGVICAVFQHTWAESLLDFRSTGAVVTFVPLFAFAVLSGLSMDYHVFVLTRIRELVAQGVPARRAVADGITDSAGTVTSAAVIMVSVFAIFVMGHGLEFKQLGVGLATAVLLDALVVRAFVLPALLTVLGEKAWRR
ncbi:MMPL family transporter [Kineosporia sp. NBRC 101677]|uniref:MMPL family transporter n=1 Tax=Kineosporia sp. NBRC 101677 TaxID=3032197 RepID=UPI002553DEBF|nr:MMPL family transporter [Kineosporia sp. NBRC 101677]